MSCMKILPMLLLFFFKRPDILIHKRHITRKEIIIKLKKRYIFCAKCDAQFEEYRYNFHQNMLPDVLVM